ncbi:MAG: hypothetical protein L3J93_05800 [Thermoplasmata archaeon]|nr:hypothetical protein [Thermoplasmata archaeon]
MPESPRKGSMESSQSSTETAVAQIVHMNPHRVMVVLSLPVPPMQTRPTVTLEWDREDTTMPLSELLQRIEAYVRQFGDK